METLTQKLSELTPTVTKSDKVATYSEPQVDFQSKIEELTKLMKHMEGNFQDQIASLVALLVEIPVAGGTSLLPAARKKLIPRKTILVHWWRIRATKGQKTQAHLRIFEATKKINLHRPSSCRSPSSHAICEWYESLT